MEKPTKGIILISEGQIIKLELHSENGEMQSEVEKLIALRNIVEAELKDLERREQAKYSKKESDEQNTI